MYGTTAFTALSLSLNTRHLDDILDHIKEEADPCKSPFDPRMPRLQLRSEDLLPEAGFSSIHRTLVGILHLCFVDCDCSDQDDGHGAEELLWPGLLEHTSLLIPSCTLHAICNFQPCADSVT